MFFFSYCDIIEDAFAIDESWNWGLEEASNNTETVSPREMNSSQDLSLKLGDSARQNIKQLNSYNFSKTTTNQITKRGKLDTPQWSTESQVSQESSDDILQTSESDKSHKISRNSTISQSPLSGQDLAMASLSGELPISNEGFDNLPNFENKEIVSNLKQELLPKVNSTLPPPKASQTPPILPPAVMGNNDDSKNMYKLGTGLSHKATNKFRTANITPPLDRYQVGFHNQVNLETLPDNSEQPDHIPNQLFAQVS